MQLRPLAPVLLLALVRFANATAFSDLASCGQQCINNMDTTVGCVPVTSECLCSNSNFLYGIRDCADSACSNSADASSAYSYATASCSSVLASTSTTAATTSAATSTSAAATTTSEASASSSASADDAASTSSGASAAVATSGSSSSATSSDASATSTAASSTATSTGSATTGSSDASASGSATSGSSSSASATSTSAASLSAAGVTNLSTAAKAGIVVGSALGAVAIVGIILYLSRKRSAPLPRGNLKISEPLPGSGRIGDEVWEQYHQPSAPVNTSQFPKPPGTSGSNKSELDRHARPYEEMVPRTHPHRMV